MVWDSMYEHGGRPDKRGCRGEAAPAYGQMGTTLTEIMIVVVLLGTLLAISVPATSTYRSTMAVQYAADEFVSSVSLARAFALRFGTIAELHVDDAAETFWVEVDTTLARSGVKDTIGSPVDLTDLQVDVKSTDSLFCFDSRGLAGSGVGCANSAAKLVFTHEAGKKDSVAVTHLGKVFR